MGFTHDEAVSALLQSQEDGAENVLGHSLEILLGEASPLTFEGDLGAPRQGGGVCSKCGVASEAGSFCGNCGHRLSPGGPQGSGVQAEASCASSEDVVTVWPEAYDADAESWVAVDLVYSFLARNPHVEWLHRGTPMLWVCAVDAGSQSGNHLRDVTPRYSPTWWRVEQARGSRVVQNWWSGVVICAHAGSTTLGAEADEKDEALLRSRCLTGEVPTTRSALKGHSRYVMRSDFKLRDVLRPGAKSVAVVASVPVYLRSDLTEAAWPPRVV